MINVNAKVSVRSPGRIQLSSTVNSYQLETISSSESGTVKVTNNTKKSHDSEPFVEQRRVSEEA